MGLAVDPNCLLSGIEINIEAWYQTPTVKTLWTAGMGLVVGPNCLLSIKYTEKHNKHFKKIHVFVKHYAPGGNNSGNKVLKSYL